MRDNRSREIKGMKNYDTPKHPGPWRMMRTNAEFAGIIVAVGFLLMGLVTMPVLILAAVPLGVAVALLLRFTRKG